MSEQLAAEGIMDESVLRRSHQLTTPTSPDFRADVIVPLRFLVPQPDLDSGPGLVHLWLRDTWITDVSLEELRTAPPLCKIM